MIEGIRAKETLACHYESKNTHLSMDQKAEGSTALNKIYLDYAATTPVDPLVTKAMQPYFTEQFGNPLSIHHFGQKAREAVEEARRRIALLIGAYPDEIIFTSGGTESNNHAIKGKAFFHKSGHIITSQVEHHSVLNSCRFLESMGFEVDYVSVDKYGFVDPVDVKKLIKRNTILISIMHANNEIGTIEPVEEIGEIAREREICFHVDAVQSFGHLPIHVDKLKIDLLSASAHKIYGPKGVGILYIRRKTRLLSLIHGGDQEDGRRASTHNVPAIVGFGRAVEIAGEKMNKDTERLITLKNKLIEGILNTIDGSILNGHPWKRLPNNVNISIKGVEGESLLLGLDMAGIACSTGSACSFATLEPSHVLHAIGLEEDLIKSAVRFSLGRYTSENDINITLEVIRRIVQRMRASTAYKR
jgi:cysteine desulfurase